MTSNTCGHKTSDGEPCELPASRPDGRCHHHTEADDQQRGGRPSKLDDRRDDVLDAAREGLTKEGCARAAGVATSTLYDWLDQYPDFSEAFKRARVEGELDLVRNADDRGARFILERSFGYTKTQEIEHSGEGVNIHLTADDED